MASKVLDRLPVETDMEYSIESFVLLNQKWGVSQLPDSKGGDVSVSFASSNYTGQFATFDSFITDDNFKDDVIAGLSMWEEVANINFILTPDAPSVDIRFGFSNIDGPNGTLGEAFLPSSGPLTGVQIILDSQENWKTGLTNNPNDLSFRYVVSHEIGHGIGIGHSELDTAFMSQFYNAAISQLTPDDVAAAQTIYGSSNIEKVDISRFFNKINGGHFFTADINERNNVLENDNFRFEGVGFQSISMDNQFVENAVPVHRFYNSTAQSHFFTADEIEKNAIIHFEDFIYEGVGFNAFQENSVSKQAVHRFFNLETGGHLFTTFELERDTLMGSSNFRYEGIGFYAYDPEIV